MTRFRCSLHLLGSPLTLEASPTKATKLNSIPEREFSSKWFALSMENLHAPIFAGLQSERSDPIDRLK